jgi:molybdenum cofactor cytidylyltransferase
VIWAVILAAGESRRMGRPKLVLPYGEGTIIETVVRNALSSRADRTVVVLGANRKEIVEKIAGFDVDRVVNARYREGMFTSVQRGLSALPASVRAAVFMLADQPDVPALAVDSLIEAYLREGRGIVLPVFRGKRGHPLLIDLKYRRRLETLSPEVGLRGLIMENPGDILEVSVPSAAVLDDIDYPDDYRRARRRVNRPRPRGPSGFNRGGR